MMSRRSLLQFLALSPLAILLPKMASAAPAAGKPANALGETEPLAKAMQYVEDSSKAGPARVDKKANCANCQKFNKCSPADTSCKPGAKDAAYAPCELFAGKAVAKNGWCLSWTKA